MLPIGVGAMLGCVSERISGEVLNRWATNFFCGECGWILQGTLSIGGSDQ